ncbi:MAG TPA: tetratricopeptide repeat protein [Verrucomicrobiae bacterium]|jgi:tetratricopeptide (TPR) repeat protein|nr:tetratricopeptide repeat protein [Verrucomicrobiae bacterium]
MSPDSSADQIYRDALEHYKHGRQEEALNGLRRVLELSPSHEDACEALSVILYNQQKYDDAAALLKQWISRHPDTVMAHTNLSRCYVAKGMIAEAEHEQAEARRLTWKAELKSKKAVMPKADYDAQIERYKKIIEFDPADVLGYFSLGTVYLECGRKREALDTFEKAVHVDPKHTASYLGLGQALESLGDVEKAKKIYRQGIQVAEASGDMMPQKKMESRIKALESGM